MPTIREAPPPTQTPHEVQAALLGKVAAGDAAAARQLVGQHLGPIVRFAFRMLGDAAEAEDIAQETFLRLWKEAPRWEPRAALATWLHRVAHNLCVDRLRANRGLALESVPERQDPGDHAPALIEAHQRTQAVAAALAELPERQRAAIALVYHEGLKNQQAAEILRVDVDGLESLLARARQTLRKRLTGS